jgi:hypothetical protein
VKPQSGRESADAANPEIWTSNKVAREEDLMLTSMLAAALALFPAEQAAQTPPGASGPSQAGAAGSADSTRPEVSARGFSQLFVLPGDAPQLFVIPESPKRAEKEKRKVICGTTVIIVDSQLDPKFVVAPKPGQAEPTIRRVLKPMCGEKQK